MLFRSCVSQRLLLWAESGQLGGITGGRSYWLRYPPGQARRKRYLPRFCRTTLREGAPTLLVLAHWTRTVTQQRATARQRIRSFLAGHRRPANQKETLTCAPSANLCLSASSPSPRVTKKPPSSSTIHHRTIFCDLRRSTPCTINQIPVFATMRR